MQRPLGYALEHVSRNEAGAELPEWTIWVAVLAVVGAALVTPVTNGLVNAFNAVLAAVPGVS